MVNAITSPTIFTSVISDGEITVPKFISGERIADLRKQHGLGQRQLATMANVDSSVISRLERNLQDDCMVSVLVAIASVLGVAIDDLLAPEYRIIEPDLVPELRAVNDQLSQHSPTIQYQAAGILRGFLSVLNEHS